MKNIIIIGASRGIGKELALRLSQSNKVLLLSRNEEALKDIQKTNPENISVSALDLSSPDVSEKLKKIVEGYFDHVDILINNAGFLVNKTIHDIERKEIENTFATNVGGLIQCCQTVIPFMKKGSHIVNIGSMGGFQGSVKFPGLSVYSASKAAVAGFSEALAEELKEDGISVNCLALGAAQTEMLEEAFPGFEAPVSAEKMAEFIGGFALSSHQWINGKVIPVSLSTP